MMTKETISDQRNRLQKGYIFSLAFSNECLDTIEELKIKSDFDDVAFERVKAERDALQSHAQELEKDKARWDYLNSRLIDFATAPEGRFYVRGLPQAFSTLREAIDAAMKGEQ